MFKPIPLLMVPLTSLTSIVFRFNLSTIIFFVMLPIFFTQSVVAQQETPYEWYDTFRESVPNPRLIVRRRSVITDQGIFRKVNARAVLGILKFELKFGRWKTVSKKTRKELLTILEDKTFRIEFTGKQSTVAHSAGAQTLGKQGFIVNGEGFLRRGVPKTPYEIAQILLHETGHVHSLRYDWFPNIGNKEKFPELLESELPSRYFTRTMIEKIERYIAEIKTESRVGNTTSKRVAGNRNGFISCPKTSYPLVPKGVVSKGILGLPISKTNYSPGKIKTSDSNSSFDFEASCLYNAHSGGTFSIKVEWNTNPYNKFMKRTPLRCFPPTWGKIGSMGFTRIFASQEKRIVVTFPLKSGTFYTDPIKRHSDREAAARYLIKEVKPLAHSCASRR